MCACTQDGRSRLSRSTWSTKQVVHKGLAARRLLHAAAAHRVAALSHLRCFR